MTDWIMEKVRFTALANGGAALGRLSDGRVVFAAGILPGELTLVRYEKGGSRYVTAEMVDVLEPSDRRITPACPLFGVCSGCQFQFLDEAEQRKEKRNILLDQLQRIAKFRLPEDLLQPYIASPQAWNYRKFMRFFIDAEGGLCFPTNSADEWVLVDTCPICSEAINELLPRLSFDPGSGISQVEIREGDAEELQLILYGESGKPETEIEIDLPVSVVYSGPEDSYVMAGDSTVLQTMAGIETAVSEDNYFYPNPAVLQRVCEEILAWLPENPVYNVLNLNAGTGFWSKWFAGRCKKVLAQDASEKNAEDFVLNLNEFENVELYIGEAQSILPGLRSKIKLVICEAGPSGINQETIAGIGATGAVTFFYIGHDASILARDAARISEQGYQLSRMIPFDDEPQTSKISALCIFSKQSYRSE